MALLLCIIIYTARTQRNHEVCKLRPIIYNKGYCIGSFRLSKLISIICINDAHCSDPWNDTFSVQIKLVVTYIIVTTLLFLHNFKSLRTITIINDCLLFINLVSSNMKHIFSVLKNYDSTKTWDKLILSLIPLLSWYLNKMYHYCLNMAV